MVKSHTVRTLAGITALILAAASCSPADAPSAGLRIRASPTPPTLGENRIIVQLPPDLEAQASVTVRGRPLDGTSGPPLPAVAAGPGVYAVAAFPFDRAGDWRLVAEVTLASGEVLRDSVDMRVVGGG